MLDAIRACWGSLFTDRALAYRLRKVISHHDMPIAVGVIELIHARASGVAFSVHPVTGKLWESEHGPQGGDEINIIEPTKNYGWGVITMGVQPGITKRSQEGMEQPIV